MLRLYQSNRFELLAKRLAELVAEPTASPLRTETLVVQHPGMARWLALEIAKATGICANIRFPLPAAFIWEVFCAFLPATPRTNRFAPELLVWHILQSFNQLTNERVFSSLREYLQVDDEVRSFKLAQHLAEQYDRYLVYRPDWIINWEAGHVAVQGDAWQAELWRRLNSDDQLHWVRLQQQLFAYQGKKPSELPERVFLIGLPTLSPGYLQIIQWLSQWSEVHLFLLNPCAEHWTEIVDFKQQARQELVANGQELYLEVGNPLLASLGRQGRDFFAAINEFDPGSEERFEDPGEATLLQRLQRQILQLQSPPESICRVDDSIQFQVCHSPMREVEVLYDQLLAMLEQQPGISPADILVMTPDIETYAPLIEAVFAQPGDRPAIPYQLSDQPLKCSNRYASAFLELLEIPGSRYPINQLLALLEFPAIARRFGLDEIALEQLTRWLEAANVRWGRDDASKSAIGLPAEPRNTWQAGLERLLLGFAMPPQSERLWQGIAPLHSAEGSNSQWLASLLGFCDAVFNLEAKLSGKHSVADWCEKLLELTVVFFTPDNSAEQSMQQVRNAIIQLQETTAAAGFHGAVSLDLVRHWLVQAFDQHTSRGFLSGGVSICALAPMRSLPFQVICLIGMHDGSFPREQPHLSFDLMRRQFRLGDRSRRADDRYLFLETLISARRRLYLSYVGHSIKDNSELPPSVLVAELQDYLATQLGTAGLLQITQQHPLQPFSAAYFTADSGLFSYSSRLREAAMQAGQGQAVDQPLVSTPLPCWDDTPHRVKLDQLIEFFTNPARAFAQQRLNLQLESGAVLLEEREPFALERYSGSELEVELVHAQQAGASFEACFELLDARGVLPHGQPGRRLFVRLFQNALGLQQRLHSLQLGELLPARDFCLPCGEAILEGRLVDLYPQGQFAFSVTRFYPHQMLRLWLQHLALCLLKPTDLQPVTFWLAGHEEGRLRPVEQPAQWLGELLDLYRQGFNQPLLFYPGTSWAYAENLLRKGDPQAAYAAARHKWQGNEWHGGDLAKPYHRLLFGDGVMLDERFMQISLAVFRPLIEHWQAEP
jgi:exodeoxyribonuclease V gamma subunit